MCDPSAVWCGIGRRREAWEGVVILGKVNECRHLI